jgi:hypothetical protein
MGKRILHLADLHLGHRHDYLGEDASRRRRREADGVLDRIASWVTGAAREKIGAVLIAGDLFDSIDPEEELVRGAIRALRSIESCGVPIVTVPGNHDEWTYPNAVFRRYQSSWPGRLVSEVSPSLVAAFNLDELRVEVVSCAFHQGHNPAPESWVNPWPAEKEANTRRVGLFHGTLDIFHGKIAEGERAFLLPYERLASFGLDYLALGHIHARRPLPASGTCQAHYPGPIEGKGPSDPGSGVLTLVDLEASPPRVEMADAIKTGIRSRDVRETVVDLVGVADLDHLERLVEADAGPEGSQPIARVVLRGRPPFPIPVEEIEARWAPRFFHLEVVAEERAIDLGDWEALATQRSLEGIFVREVLRKRAAAGIAGNARYWDLVAEEGLHALGRGRGAR